jgi:hypothetical protein
MASTLFGKVAHRVASRFFLDVAPVDFALAFFAVVRAGEAALEAEFFVEVCDLPAVRAVFAAVYAAPPRVLLPCTCVPGASFTGSETVRELPGLTVFDER